MDARGVSLLAQVRGRGWAVEELLGPVDDGLASHYSSLSESSGEDRGLREASVLFSVAHASLMKDGDAEDALQAATQSLSHFRSRGDTKGVADAARLVVSAHCRMEQDGVAMDAVSTELARFRARGCQRGVACMLLSEGEVQLTRRQPGEALHSLEQALPAFRSLGERALEASALLATSVAHAMEDWVGEAADAATQAASIFQELGEKRGEGRSWQAAAWAHIAADDPASATGAAKNALSLFMGSGDVRLEAQAWTLMADAQSLNERPGDALRNASRALRAYQQAGDVRGEGGAWGRVANAYADRGDHAEALRRATIGLMRMRKAGSRAGEALVQDALLHVHLLGRENESALKAGWEAMELFRDLGCRRHQADRLLVVALLHLVNQQQDWAAQALREAKELYGQLGDQMGEALVQYARVHLSMEQGKPEQALRAAEDARALFQELGNVRWGAEALLAGCHVHRATGEFSRLVKGAREANELFEEAGDARAAAAALLEISDVHLTSGHHQAALEAAEDAAEVLKEAGYKRGRAEALSLMASIHLAIEEPERALTLAQEARELCKRAEDRGGEADALHLLTNCSLACAAQEALAQPGEGGNRGTALLAASQPPRSATALKSARDAVDMARRIGDGDRLALALQSLARALMLNGCIDEAQGVLDEVVTVSRQAKEEGARSAAFTARAEAHLLGDRPDLALMAADKALALTHGLGDRRGEAYAREVITHIVGSDEPQEASEEVAEPEEEEDDDDEPFAAQEDSQQLSVGPDPGLVRGKVHELAASATGVDEDYADDSPFMEAGLDSLSAVEFRNRLQKEFQVSLPAAVMFDHPTVTSLVEHLVEETRAFAPPAAVSKRKASPKRKPRITRVVRQKASRALPPKRRELQAKARLSQDLRIERPCIVGTWDDWAVHEMEWNAAEKCYKSSVQVGSNRWESFQMLSDGNWKRCLYPDQRDAGLESDFALCGPDGDGHGRNFMIGGQSEPCLEGDTFDVRLWLNSDGFAEKVDWVRMASGQGASAAAGPQPYIVGTWSDWTVMQSMSWDEVGQCYQFDVRLGKKGWESFQILMNRQWSSCLHPDKRDGCPHHPHTLCGPDGHGEGKNWTIGKHPLDRGAAGASYLVRLSMRADGSPAAVDWTRD